MDVSTISLVGGLAIAGLTTVGNIWLTYVNKKKELEKEITLKVLESSFKEYEFRTNYAIKAAEKEGRSATLYPYDYYLIHFAQLAKLIDKEKITEESVRKVVEKQKLFRRTYKAELEKDEMY
ncbi:hypothetical protein [Psychrobacillus sp. BM2]|uniref:hypothetical protein n=1 Tax=Psychrobacillus sp. BM2 TaxID=3400421 RepID=UPI003B021354